MMTRDKCSLCNKSVIYGPLLVFEEGANIWLCRKCDGLVSAEYVLAMISSPKGSSVVYPTHTYNSRKHHWFVWWDFGRKL